jgi:hypothetical protein
MTLSACVRCRSAAAALVVALALASFPGGTAFAGAEAEFHAVQFRAYSDPPQFQLLVGFDQGANPAASGPLFGPAGGVFAAARMDGGLYASEFDIGGSDWFLATIPTDSTLFGQGARVGAMTFGFDNVEGLAGRGSTLLGAAIDYSAHDTRILDIDPTTGTATLIGRTSRNVVLTGLAWDARNDIVYAVGVPFGGGEPNAVDEANLYTIDPATGGETLVGALGTTLQSLAWHPDYGLYGAFAALYAIDRDSGAATMAGATDYSNGDSGNGLYALAPNYEGAVKRCGDANGDTSVSATDALVVLQVAVGVDPGRCGPECDVNASGNVNSTDALQTLRAAVNALVQLLCP